MAKRKPPMEGLTYQTVGTINSRDYDEHGNPDESRWFTDDLNEAHVITSRTAEDSNKHKVVIDLDLSAVLVPSSTKGHFHLFIDKELGWEQYAKLLGALQDAGLLEEGYVNAALSRGFTAVRLPWIKKHHSEITEED